MRFRLALLILGALSPALPQNPVYSRLPAAAAPPARIDGALAYDPQSRRIWMFGGDTGGPANDLWYYSLADRTWRQVDAPNPPPARFGHTLIFDAPRRRLVVFGGQAIGFFNDTWTLDVDTPAWTRLQATGPGARYGHSGVFDSARGRMLISHGFTSAGRFDDTWALDLASGAWRDVSPTARPLRRCLHHAVYDPQGDQMLLYGGCASGTPVPNNCPLGDLWSFDIASGRWREIAQQPRPAGRQWYGMAFDVGRRRLVIQGGSGRSDTWEFDPAAGTWQQAMPAGETPGSIDRHEGAYVPELGGVVFFGGSSGGTRRSDLWLYGPPLSAEPSGSPAIAEDGILGAFSSRILPLAPGKLVSIFGRGLGPEAPVTSGFDASGRLPLNTAGVSVTVGGLPAPILFAWMNQVNIQVPYEASPGPAEVRVSYRGAAGNTLRTSVQPTSPELFPRSLHLDASLVSRDQPAEPGEILIFYATGQGATTPPSATGAIAVDVFPDPAAPVRLLIGGAEAEILFKGQTPGTAGTMQINARVPLGTRSGAAPVVLEVGAVRSQDGVVADIR